MRGDLSGARLGTSILTEIGLTKVRSRQRCYRNFRCLDYLAPQRVRRFLTFVVVSPGFAHTRHTVTDISILKIGLYAPHRYLVPATQACAERHGSIDTQSAKPMALARPRWSHVATRYDDTRTGRAFAVDGGCTGSPPLSSGGLARPHARARVEGAMRT